MCVKTKFLATARSDLSIVADSGMNQSSARRNQFKLIFRPNSAQ
jgi:hypothetical protein